MYNCVCVAVLRVIEEETVERAKRAREADPMYHMVRVPVHTEQPEASGVEAGCALWYHTSASSPSSYLGGYLLLIVLFRGNVPV